MSGFRKTAANTSNRWSPTPRGFMEMNGAVEHIEVDPRWWQKEGLAAMGFSVRGHVLTCGGSFRHRRLEIDRFCGILVFGHASTVLS